MAHFMEHMLFKGTQTRNNRQILNFLELVGGEINAYTTKEYTCLYASFLDQFLEKGLDLLKDMVANSKFPIQEIEREKGVIGDEIDSYRDIPEEFIQDDFDELLFQAHPLGQNILGTRETIHSLQQQDLFDFKNEFYKASGMILGIYNSMPYLELRNRVGKFFSDLPSSSFNLNRLALMPHTPQKKLIYGPVHQVHGLIGSRSYALPDSRRVPMLLLMNLLGGPGMSSRLNLEIREKRGICYQIESSYTPLSDTGMFSIYFGTDPEKYEKCLELILLELKKLRVKGLSSLYLHQSKVRFKGQIALADENHSSVLISLCKSIQDYGYADSIQEIFRQIDAISHQDILEVANDQLSEEGLSSLILLPEKE
jgi:predicted Zn-dependent peptidase